jgi:hypothetical protein
MDNVRTHKVAGVRETIEAAAAQLRYLPAYSPDLNPIENAYAKIKSDLRKGAARTALWKLVGRSMIAPLQSAAGTQTGHPVLATDSDRNAGQRTKGLASLPRSRPGGRHFAKRPRRAYSGRRSQDGASCARRR